MRDRIEDLLKWTRRYRLRDRPEALIEAITANTHRRRSFVLGLPLILFFDTDKNFYGECTESAIEIWRASAYSSDRHRMPRIRGDLQPKGGYWEMEAKIAFEGIRIDALSYGVLAALCLAVLVMIYNSAGLNGPAPWIFLGVVLFALLLFLGMENARRQQETEALISFFEKLVAPYVDEAATITSNADARDP